MILNRKIENRYFPYLFILFVLLIGYYKLWLGGNFFVEEDATILYNYALGNAGGNGWRPDKGFGTSFFFGDPGAFHAWSLFSFWEKLFQTPYLAYTLSILGLLFAAATAHYHLLKTVFPNLGSAAYILAPMIVLSPLQYEFYFQRHWIALSIGTPLLLLILTQAYQKLRVSHFFQLSLVAWIVLFLGSVISLEEFLVTGALISIIYGLHHKELFKKIQMRTLLLYVIALPSVVMLGAWVFYSIFIEFQLVDYVRDPNYAASHQGFGLFLFLKSGLLFLSKMLHSGWFPPNESLLIPPSFDVRTSWMNLTPFFPLIFLLFVTRKQGNVYVSLSKWMLIAFFGHELLLSIIPTYGNIWAQFLGLYPLEKFQPAYFTFEMILVAAFILQLKESSTVTSSWAPHKILGCVLSGVYTSLMFLFGFVFLFREKLEAIAHSIIQFLNLPHLLSLSESLFLKIISFNLDQVQRIVSWPSFLYFGVTATMFALICLRPSLFKQIQTPTVALLFLATNLLLSWSVYPLNEKKMIWDSVAPEFKATDRFYGFVESSYQSSSQSREHYLDKNWFRGEFGPREELRGYNIPPGLNLSGIKSFTQREVAEYIFHAFNRDGLPRLRSQRDLTGGPSYHSTLLDVASIPYYYSRRELTSKSLSILSPLFKKKQLYIYKNENSRPYYYLAHQIEPQPNLSELSDIGKTVTYLEDKTMIPQEIDAFSSVNLRKFSYGKLVFDYKTEKKSVLVINDAWHPLWKARVEGKEIPVVKANYIFKGILLPPGEKTVTCYFDTSKYWPGMYISAIAWFFFIFCWSSLWLKSRKRS